MRNVKKILGVIGVIALFAFAPTVYRLIPFGSATTNDTSYSKGSLRVDGALRFTGYGTSDSTKVLTFNSNGLAVVRSINNLTGNFATTDLTLTANRVHDLNDHGMVWRNTYYFNVADTTGDTVFTIGNFAAPNNYMFRISPYINVIQAYDKTHRGQWQLSEGVNYSGVGTNITSQVSAGSLCYTRLVTDTVTTFNADSATQRIWLGNYLYSKGIEVNWNTGATTLHGDLHITGKIGSYNGVAGSAGMGVPLIVATGRATGQTAANTSVLTYTIPGTDGTYEVSANVNVTTSSSESFSVVYAYTDETNTLRNMTLSFLRIAGSTVNAVTSANGAVPYASLTVPIRCKASTTITLATTGTFTGCTYNVEGVVKQLQ